MVRANRRIKKDARSGFFVAVLYAVLNPEERLLSFSNAGQTQPIHYSARTREVALLEGLGDSFPLGILDTADYQETEFPLEPGDKVIFYTDGVVEAMNKKQEIFGFERFQEVVRNAGGLPADALLQEIAAQVAAFVKDAPQHDDLTVIVVAVDEDRAEKQEEHHEPDKEK